MPQPAEIDPLVFELDDRGDLREAVDALDERVFDRLAETPRQREQASGRQFLIAKENDEVVEPGLADRRDGLGVELLREIDAENLGADRPRQRADVEPLPGHGHNLTTRRQPHPTRTVQRPVAGLVGYPRLSLRRPSVQDVDARAKPGQGDFLRRGTLRLGQSARCTALDGGGAGCE
jgi:hypothetical protein